MVKNYIFIATLSLFLPLWAMQEVKTTTALHEAVSHDKYEEAKRILAIEVLERKEYSIDALNKDGQTALAIAIRGRDFGPLLRHMTNIKMIELLVQNGASVNMPIDKRGNFALHLITIYRTQKAIEAARIVIPKMRDIDVRGQGNNTALFWACWGGRAGKDIWDEWLPLVRFLLEKGANPDKIARNVYTKLGKFTEFERCRSRRPTKELQQADFPVSPPMPSQVLSSYQTVENEPEEPQLTSSKFTPSPKLSTDSQQLLNRDYLNPMVNLFIEACSEGNLEVAKYLRLKIQDIDQEDMEGQTALAVACRGRKIDIIRWLLENNSRPEKIAPSFFVRFDQDIKQLLFSESSKPSSSASQSLAPAHAPTPYKAPRVQQQISPSNVVSAQVVYQPVYVPQPVVAQYRQQNHHHGPHQHSDNLDSAANFFNAVANVEKGVASVEQNFVNDLNAVNKFN